MAIYHVTGGGNALQDLISLSTIINYDEIVVGDGNYNPISSNKILYIRSENGPTKTGIRTKLSTVVVLPKESRISGFYLDHTIGSGGYYDVETTTIPISCYLYNCHLYKPSRVANYHGFVQNTTIENCQFFRYTSGWPGSATAIANNCTILNCKAADISFGNTDWSVVGGNVNTKCYNCTFVNINGNNGWYSTINQGSYYNCIFSNITNNYRLSAVNVQFYNCSFDEATLTDTRNGNNMSAVMSARFHNCYFGDPIFRDVAAQDYTLKKASPIKTFGSPSYLKTTYDFANKLWNTEHPSIGCYQFYELPWHWIPNSIIPIGNELKFVRSYETEILDYLMGTKRIYVPTSIQQKLRSLHMGAFYHVGITNNKLNIPNLTRMDAGIFSVNGTPNLRILKVPNITVMTGYTYYPNASGKTFDLIDVSNVQTINKNFVRHATVKYWYFGNRTRTDLPAFASGITLAVGNADSGLAIAANVTKIVLPDEMYDTWISTSPWSGIASSYYMIKTEFDALGLNY